MREMKRKDRGVTDFQELIKIIEHCDVIRLGLADKDGVYVVPMNFGYEVCGDKLFFYLHSASEGRKIDLMKNCPVIGFELDGKMEIRPADKACSWGAAFESVIGTGHISFLETAEQKQHALTSLMKKYGYEGVPDFQPEMIKKIAVIKLEVQAMSGKRRE